MQHLGQAKTVCQQSKDLCTTKKTLTTTLLPIMAIGRAFQNLVGRSAMQMTLRYGHKYQLPIIPNFNSMAATWPVGQKQIRANKVLNIATILQSTPLQQRAATSTRVVKCPSSTPTCIGPSEILTAYATSVFETSWSIANGPLTGQWLIDGTFVHIDKCPVSRPVCKCQILKINAYGLCLLPVFNRAVLQALPPVLRTYGKTGPHMEVATGRESQILRDPPIPPPAVSMDDTGCGNLCSRCRKNTSLLADDEKRTVLRCCATGFRWHGTLGKYLKREKRKRPNGRRSETIDPSGSGVGLALGCEQIDWILSAQVWKSPSEVSSHVGFAQRTRAGADAAEKATFGTSLCFIFHSFARDLWDGMVIDSMGHGQDEPFPSRENHHSQSDRQYLGQIWIRTGSIWPRSRLVLQPCKRFETSYLLVWDSFFCLTAGVTNESTSHKRPCSEKLVLPRYRISIQLFEGPIWTSKDKLNWLVAVAPASCCA